MPSDKCYVLKNILASCLDWDSRSFILIGSLCFLTAVRLQNSLTAKLLVMAAVGEWYFLQYKAQVLNSCEGWLAASWAPMNISLCSLALHTVWLEGLLLPHLLHGSCYAELSNLWVPSEPFSQLMEWQTLLLKAHQPSAFRSNLQVTIPAGDVGTTVAHLCWCWAW